MSGHNITVTRRTLLGGVATLGLGSAAAGAGTVATFTDSASSNGHSLDAGTLNLTLDGSDATVQFLSEVDVSPGDSGTSTVTLANTGSLTGYVDVEVASMTDYENDCVNGEASAEDNPSSSCDDPGQGQGELQDHLEVHAEFQNGDELWSGFDTVANKLSAGTVYDEDYQLDGGTSDDFVLDWQLPSGAGDEAQSDSVEFALTFSLDQQPDLGA